MTQKIFLYSLLIGVSFLSCFNTPKKTISFSEKIETQKDTILSKEEIYKKIEEYTNNKNNFNHHNLQISFVDLCHILCF